jgi:hypothetical protein
MKTEKGRSRVLGGFVVLAVLSVGMGAYAGPVTLTLDGVLDDVHEHLAGRFAVGDPIHVTITYEAGTPDVFPGDLMLGYYPCITDIDISVAGYTASGSNGSFNVYNDEFGRDLVSATASSVAMPGGTLTGDPVNGWPLWLFEFEFNDSTGTVFSSDALPTTFDPSRFDFALLRVAWREGGYNRYISTHDFTITSTTPVVPVPGALLLSGVGLGFVGWFHRRTSRAG